MANSPQSTLTNGGTGNLNAGSSITNATTVSGSAGLVGNNGAVNVIEPTNGQYVVTFTGPLFGADQTFAQGTAVTAAFGATINGIGFAGVQLTSDEQAFVASSTGNGGFSLTFNGATTGALNFTGTTPPTAAAVQGALNNLPTVNANGGGVVVNSPIAGSYVIQFTGPLANSGQNFITATISGAAVTIKTGSTSVTGDMSVASLGLSATQYGNVPEDLTVSANAALELLPGRANLNASTPIQHGIALNSTGFSIGNLNVPTGGIRVDNASGVSGDTGSALITSEIAMGANAGVSVDSTAGTLSLGGTGANAGNTQNGFITGAFALNKDGPGTVELGGTGNDNYTGVTNLNDGILLLNKIDPGPTYQFKPYATGTGVINVVRTNRNSPAPAPSCWAPMQPAPRSGMASTPPAATTPLTTSPSTARAPSISMASPRLSTG